MTMKWVIDPVSELENKWEVWDHLNRLYYNSHPYFDSRFIKPCLKYYADDAVKLAQLENKNHEIQGMVLLRKGSYGMWQLFSTSQMQIVPILLNPEYGSHCLQRLLRILPGFCWRLDSLYQDTDYTPIRKNGFISEQFHCQTTSIAINCDFSSYWKQRKKNLKKNIQRYLNRIKKEKIRLNFTKLGQQSDLKNGLLRYGSLESLGWKKDAGTAIHSDNTQGLFYNDVLQSFAVNRQAFIYELYINDELAASRISIQNADMNIILKVTYNENMKQFAPGKVLLYKMLENEFKCNNYKKIEFYTNATKDQIDWSTSTRNIFHFEIYRNRFWKKLITLKNRK